MKWWKKIKLDWFWIAFILVVLIGAIASIITLNAAVFASAMSLALFMGIGKFFIDR